MTCVGKIKVAWIHFWSPPLSSLQPMTGSFLYSDDSALLNTSKLSIPSIFYTVIIHQLEKCRKFGCIVLVILFDALQQILHRILQFIQLRIVRQIYPSYTSNLIFFRKLCNLNLPLSAYFIKLLLQIIQLSCPKSIGHYLG